MTKNERITALEARIAQMEARLRQLETAHLVYGPIRAPAPAPILQPFVKYDVTC